MKYRDFFKEDIERYLVWEPQGELRRIADKLNKLISKPNELYRGMDQKEFDVLQKVGRVKSLGKGMTRNVEGSYLANDVHLAARFALVNFRDKGNGFVVAFDKSKLPDLKQVDPGNFVTSYLPIEAVVYKVDLRKL